MPYVDFGCGGDAPEETIVLDQRHPRPQPCRSDGRENTRATAPDDADVALVNDRRLPGLFLDHRQRFVSSRYGHKCAGTLRKGCQSGDAKAHARQEIASCVRGWFHL
jgi:hypothetical protein